MLLVLVYFCLLVWWDFFEKLGEQFAGHLVPVLEVWLCDVCMIEASWCLIYQPQCTYSEER